MSNKFDSTNYPSQVPAVLQKGDFWAWKRDDLASDYPLASYGLKYKFYLIDGSTAANFTLTATESNDEYIISTSSTTSQTAGDYRWDAMDQSSMSIAGRSLSRMSIDELLTFKDRYKAEWLKEVKMARIKNNQGSGNTIKVNFGSSSNKNITDLT